MHLILTKLPYTIISPNDCIKVFQIKIYSFFPVKKYLKKKNL